MPVLSSPRKSCFGIDVYLDSDKELGSNLGKLSEAYKNLKGFGGETVTKAAFMSLNVKHINVCSVKTNVIVTPGLPDLWERLLKKQKGAQSEVNLVGLLYLVSLFFDLNLNVIPFSNLCPADSWLGSPVLNFENVPSFLFFCTVLYTC